MNRAIYRLLWLNHVLRKWLSQQLTPTGLLLLGGLFVLGLIGLDIKRSLSYQIFIFCLAIFAISFLSSRWGRYRLRATRRLPRLGTVGVPLSYRVVIHSKQKKRVQGLTLIERCANTFPSFQVFSKLVNSGRPKNRTFRKTPATNGRNGRNGRKAWFRLLARQKGMVAPVIALPPIAASGETEVTAEVLPLRRGLLSFHDPLGLVNRCITQRLPQSVLILPKRYQLPALELPGSRQYQADTLALSASLGDSQEFRALREYRPGDSPRKIHWKSWAKLGRPVIREEQAEFSVRHSLILDTFQSEDYSDGLEEAVAIAASLACTVQTQESLLDMVFDSDQAKRYTNGQCQEQTQHQLELLASVVPCQDQPFESLQTVVRSRFSLLSGCICILLDWDSDRKALIEQLQAANIPTLVLIVAPAGGLTEVPNRSCLKNAQSSLHVLTLGQIQEGLLAL